ncbi:hypothetical protein QR680_007282 [Steinernema hermaphroditum]|uniref:Clc-like protein n=1 Tax=Steinernema hermaphroditum TaxID=289476 RepID=A0AA39LYV8_9BILA|nr:hypothetical protein QR680_007282 [Steinernema hermaphroditum]
MPRQLLNKSLQSIRSYGSKISFRKPPVPELKMASTAVKKLFLVLSILLIIVGLGFSIAGLFSPAWQVVDIREFRAEHQHGLWWDCIRSEKHVVAVGDFYEESPLHCMYKFDESASSVIENTLLNIDEDGAAGESEHHRFWAWHKAVLFFIIFSQFLAFLSICTGICAPCFPATAFVFTICLFLALLSSVIADGVFFLAANRVDNRFVQGMVGTYEQRIGYAFYLHIMGTVCWSIAFMSSLATTYKFFSGQSGSSSDVQFSAVPQRDPLLEKYTRPLPPYPHYRRETSA